MKTQFKTLILSAAITATSPQIFGETLTIGFDKSGSNALMTDAHFAAGAADFVYERIKPLKNGDIVRLRTFGSRDNAGNEFAQDFKITRHLQAESLAQSLKNFIHTLPNQKDQAQQSTNIIAEIEFDDGLNCDGGGTAVYLTDGLEHSVYVDANKFLAGQQHLPKPQMDLTGCTVIFYGIGTGFPANAERFMRAEWKAFIETAGGKFIPK